MTAPSPLVQALQQISTMDNRCRFGKVFDTLNPLEQEAVTETFAAKVAAGRAGVPWPTIAKILTEATGSKVTEDDLRHHAKKECRCE